MLCLQVGQLTVGPSSVTMETTWKIKHTNHFHMTCSNVALGYSTEINLHDLWLSHVVLK